MGIAGSLFFNSDPDVQSFHRRIVPSDPQQKAQQERWNDLAEWLKTRLSEDSGLPVRSWLQGSYKSGTQLRPVAASEEFDIDLGIYFEWPGQPEDGEHSPADLRSRVQNALLEYAKDNDDVTSVVEPPKSRCSRIHYRDHFHIDVPTYHLDASRDARSLATADDAWEESDPKAIYVWLRDLVPEARRPRLRRMVRYVKCWAVLRFPDQAQRPTSVLLSVLVGEAVAELVDEAAQGDDEVLATVLGCVVGRLARDPRVRNPVNQAEVLSERMGAMEYVQFRDALAEFLDLAGEAANAPIQTVAADLWSQAFKHFFPLPEPERVVAESTAVRGIVRVVFEPRVLVHAIRQKPIYGRTNEWRGMNSIGPIPKKCDLTFTLTNPSQLPPGAKVEWVVRNEGQEAEAVNDLGHLQGTGRVVEEKSAYTGRHWMDCVVRLNRVVIGLQRVPVTIQ